ncbi:MAG: virulence factor [Gammaproteobacteria bacterium]|nr:virulence factor [Gammaproteobacteria bacterium]MCZ6667263.1 virulence factor [Gammaproteobacteria bacterium]
MAKLKIVYWNDIPGRVVVREGRRSTRIRLSARFMKAIERACYRLKKHDKDAFFEPWRDVDQPFTGDIREQAKILVRRLEEEYSDAVLDKLIKASGKDESRSLNS